jgi:O-antigen ligase
LAPARGTVFVRTARDFIRMTYLNLRWLAGFSAVYLFLLSTNHGTYLRSAAFGGSLFFAACAVGWSFKERTSRPEARIPFPPWSIVLTFAAWSGWSALSYFWSVRPEYTAGQLNREIVENALVLAFFFIAARDTTTFRGFVITALLSFVFMSLLALGFALTPEGWDPALKHNGVGPYTTYLVLTAPLLVAVIAPPPIGVKRRDLAIAGAGVLLVLMVATARLTDNRMVWIALAAVFATAAIASAVRWPATFMRSPWRWLAPVAALLVILGYAFADAAMEKAETLFPPNTSVEATLMADPRIRLWQHMFDKIGDRPWLGYGFGRLIQAKELTRELDDSYLTHAHNIFASQWLQTGVVGLGLFVAVLAAFGTTCVRYVRSRDDRLACVGVVGLSLLAGFVVKNLTDDFMFRSNAKEFWSLLAILTGYGARLTMHAPVPAARLPAD